MSFNQKILYTSFFIIALIFGSGAWYYKKTHTRQYAPIPPRPEVTLTIIPGWNLRQVADYLVKQGFASSTEDVYKITGKPAYEYKNLNEALPPYPVTAVAHKPTTSSEKITDLEMFKPENISYEGYLAPETYRVFRDASVLGIVAKMVKQQDKDFILDFYNRTWDLNHEYSPGVLGHPREIHQILTMASIIEKEVKYDEDRAVVADILWRRLAKGWALQVDSSVHYAVDRTGDVFTTDKERSVDSPWNTYKYPGLPPGPISNPGIESIKAAIYPEKNNYWYFLSDKDSHMHYAKTLDEHNFNRVKF